MQRSKCVTARILKHVLLKCTVVLFFLVEIQLTLLSADDGTLIIVTDEPLRGVSPGQVAALWDGDWCLGCGVIIGAGNRPSQVQDDFEQPQVSRSHEKNIDTKRLLREFFNEVPEQRHRPRSAGSPRALDKLYREGRGWHRQ